MDDVKCGRLDTGDKPLTFKAAGKNVTVTMTASMLFGAVEGKKTFILSGGDNGETLTFTLEKEENLNSFRPMAIRAGNTLILKNGAVVIVAAAAFCMYFFIFKKKKANTDSESKTE